jgi:hypothetical protein
MVADLVFAALIWDEHSGTHTIDSRIVGINGDAPSTRGATIESHVATASRCHG